MKMLFKNALVAPVPAVLSTRLATARGSIDSLMRPRSDTSTFRLEALEQRLLLSADDSLLRPSSAAPDSLEPLFRADHEHHEELLEEPSADFGSGLFGDLFGGSDLQPLGSDPAPETAALDPGQAGDSPAGDPPVEAPSGPVVLERSEASVRLISSAQFTGDTLAPSLEGRLIPATPILPHPSAEIAGAEHGPPVEDATTPEPSLSWPITPVPPVPAVGDVQQYIQLKLADYVSGLFTGEQTFAPGDLNLGGFLALQSPTISFQNIQISAGAATSGLVKFSAGGAKFFDGSSFSAGISDGVDADSLAVEGTYDVATKVYSLNLDQFELRVGEAIRVKAASLSALFDATNNAPNQTLAVVGSATVGSALFDGVPFVNLSNFVLRKNGFHVGDATFSLAAGGTARVGGFLTLSGLAISVDDLDVAYGATTTVTGSVTASADGLTLFADTPFITTSATGLVASFDLGSGASPSGSITLSAGSINLGVGGAVLFNGANVVMRPGSMVRQGSSDVALSLVGNMTVLGQLIEGSFQLNRTNGVLTLSAGITRLQLSAGTSRIVELSGTGDFLVNAGGVAGVLSLNLVQGPSVVGLGLAGAFQLRVNTLNAQVVFGTTTIAPGPYVRVAVRSATVTVLGNGITADLFLMERRGTGAGSYIEATASGVGLRLIAGTASLTVSEGAGAFLITSAGIAGRAQVGTAVLSGVPGVALAAAGLSIETNSTGGDVGPVEVIASGSPVKINYQGAANHNFVRISGQASLDLDGFLKLSGSFVFDRSTLSGGGMALRGSVSNLQGVLGAVGGDGKERGLAVSEINGALLMVPQGIALAASGKASLTGFSGVQTSATIAVRVNTTAGPVNETVGGTPVFFASGAETEEITGLISLEFAGYATFSGDYTFERSFDGVNTRLRVGATGVTALMGAGGKGVQLAGGNLGLILFPEMGAYALSISGAASLVGFAGGTLSGILSAKANTTGMALNEILNTNGGSVVLGFADGALLNVIEGAAELEITGFSKFSGNYTFRQDGTGSATKILAAVTGVETFLGAAGVGVRIQNAQMALALYPGTGKYAINANGTASLEGVSGVALSGSLSAAVNNTGGAVFESIAIPGGALQVQFNDRQGNLFRFQGAGLQVQLGAAVSIGGSFAFERAEIGGETILKIGASGVQALMHVGGKGIAVTGGTLGMLVRPDGTYGLQATGSASVIGIPDVEASGALTLRFNNTGQVRGETIDTGALTPAPSSLPVVVTLNLAASVGLQFSGTQVGLRIAGNELKVGSPISPGQITLTQTGSQIEASGQNVSFTLAAGGKRIVGMEGASFGFLFRPQGVAGLVLGGTVNGPDFGGNIDLQGVFSLMLNTTPDAATITAPGQPSVSLPGAPAGGSYVKVQVTTPSLVVYGNTLSADLFVLEREESAVRLTGVNLDFELRAGSKRVAGIQDASFAFRFTQNGLAGLARGGSLLGPDFANLSLTGGLSLEVNTTAQSQVLQLPTGAVEVAAAETGAFFVRASVTGGQLTVFGNQLMAEEFIFEKSGANVSVGGRNLDFSMNTSGKRVLDIEDASFAFSFSQDGIAGAALGGQFRGPDYDGVEVNGTVNLLLNTTSAARTLRVQGTDVLVPAAAGAGHFVRVEIQNGMLSVLGNGFSAEKFVFESSGAGIAVSGGKLGFNLAAGTNRIVGIRDADFGLTFFANGVAGAVVNASLLPPELTHDLSLSGTARVLFNTTGVSQTVGVGGIGGLVVPSGAPVGGGPASGFVRVEVSGGQIGILGQQLSGDFTFEQATVAGEAMVRISAASVRLKLGDGSSELLVVDGAGINLEVSTQGVLGNFAGTVTSRVPGVSFGGGFSVMVNTRNPANRYVRVVGTSVSIVVSGQTLTGDFMVEQTQTANGQQVVGIAVDKLALTLGDGTNTYAAASDGEGYFLLSPIGVTASATASVVVTIPGVTFTGGGAKLDINTSSLPVSANFLIGDNPPSNLAVEAGPFVRVVVTGAKMAIAAGGAELNGDFFFEQSTRPDLSKVVKFGVANLSVEFGGQGVKNGSGAFVVLPADSGVAGSGGIAGSLSGEASIAVGGLAVGGSFGLRVNKSLLAVNESLTFAGKSFDIAFADGSDVFEFFGANLTLALGDFVTIEGSAISFPGGVFSGTGVRVFLGRGPALLPNGDINPAAVGVLLQNADIGMRDLGVDGHALFASGSIRVLGVPGVSVSGTATIRVNPSSAQQTVTLPGGGGSQTLDAGIRRFESANMSLQLLGQVVTGDFAFSKPAAGAVNQSVVISGANLEVRLGAAASPLVSVTAGSGLFVLSEDGIAGRAAASVAVSGGTGISLTGSYSLAINTMARKVEEVATFGTSTQTLSLPFGPYLRVQGIGAGLSVAGQSLNGDFEFQQRVSGGLDGNLATTGDNKTVVSVAFANASLSLAGGVVSATKGSGLFVLTPAGLAGRAAVQLSVAASAGASAAGSFALTINRTGLLVSETLEVDGLPATVQIPAGTFTKISGANVSLIVAGQAMSGNFDFSSDAAGVSVKASQVSMNLGSGLVNVSLGSGAFLITASGFAGTFAANLALAPSANASFSGAVKVAVNNTGNAVSQTLNIDGSAVTLDLEAGPYLRVDIGSSATPAALTVAGQSLTGQFAIETRSRVSDTGGTDVTIAFKNVSVQLGDGATTLLTVSGGNGLFVLSASGLAGQAQGSLLINPATGVGFTGAVGLAINNTAAPISRVFQVGSQRVTLELPAGPYLRVTGLGAQLSFASSVTLTGDFSFEQTTTLDSEQVVKVAASKVSASLVAGSAKVELGAAQGLFVLKAAGIAGRASGKVSLSGIPGLSLDASMNLEFNKTGALFNETIGGETLLFGESNFLRITGSGKLAVVGSIEVQGSFSFESGLSMLGSAIVKVAATDVRATLGVPGSFGVQLSGGRLGMVLVGSGAYALDASGVVSLVGYPSLSLGGAVVLRVNKTLAPVNESFSVGAEAVSLNFGPGETNSVRFEARNARLSTPLAVIQGTFGFEKSGDTNDLFAIGTGLSLFAGDDRGTPTPNDDVGVRVTNASLKGLLLPTGAFALEATGLAEVANVIDLEFTGSFGVQFNSTGQSISRSIQVNGVTNSLVLGPDVRRFGGDHITLKTPVASLIGSFVVESGKTAGVDGVSGTSDDEDQIAIAATGVNLFVGDDKGTGSESDDLGVRVSGAELVVLLSNIGYALQASGGASVVGVTGVALQGNVGVQENALGSALNRRIEVGGVTQVLNLAAGVSRFGGSDVVLEVAGQKLKGDFSIERVTAGPSTTVKLTLAKVFVGLGDGGTDFVTVSNGAGVLTLSSTGLAGSFSASVGSAIPSLKLGGAFTVAVQTDNLNSLNNFVRVTSTGASVEVLGQTLATDLAIEQITTVSGAKLVRMGVSGLFASLGDGGNTFVSISNGTGLLLISAGGVAADFQVNPLFSIPGVVLSGGASRLRINTAGSGVNESLMVAGAALSVNVPAGPYVRVEVSGAVLRIGAAGGPELSGDFAFEQVTKAGGGKLTRVGVSRLSVGFDGQGLSNGDGGFIIKSTGIAGVFSGDISIAGGGVQGSGRMGLRVNKTGGALDETISVSGRSIAIKFGEAEGDLFSFSAQDLSFKVGDFVVIEGSVSFSSRPDREVFAGSNLLIFLGQGPLKQANGQLNPAASGVLLRNATVGLVQFANGTLALQATGSMEAIGLGGVVLAGDGSVRFNNTGQIISESIAFPASGQNVMVNFGAAGFVAEFGGQNVTLSVLGQSLTGSIGFSKVLSGPSAGSLKVAASNIGVSLGGGLLSVTQGSGTMLLSPSGLAGDFGASVAVNVPGVSAGGTFRVRLNNTGLAVNDAGLGLSLPSGPYLQVRGTGAYLDVAGQRMSGDFVIERVVAQSGGSVLRVGVANEIGRAHV